MPQFLKSNHLCAKSKTVSAHRVSLNDYPKFWRCLLIFFASTDFSTIFRDDAGNVRNNGNHNTFSRAPPFLVVILSDPRIGHSNHKTYITCLITRFLRVVSFSSVLCSNEYIVFTFSLYYQLGSTQHQLFQKSLVCAKGPLPLWLCLRVDFNWVVEHRLVSLNLSDANISGQATIWRFPTCCGASSSASFLHFGVFDNLGHASGQIHFCGQTIFS